MNETPGIGVLSVTGRKKKGKERLTIIIARLFVLHTHILPLDAPYRPSPANKRYLDSLPVIEHIPIACLTMYPIWKAL